MILFFITIIFLMLTNLAVVEVLGTARVCDVSCGLGVSSAGDDVRPGGAWIVPPQGASTEGGK